MLMNRVGFDRPNFRKREERESGQSGSLPLVGFRSEKIYTLPVNCNETGCRCGRPSAAGGGDGWPNGAAKTASECCPMNWS